MEVPALVVFLLVFGKGRYGDHLVPLALLVIWLVHYIHRSLIFSFRIRAAGKSMLLLVVTLGIVFNIVNAYLNARWISHLEYYRVDWLTRPLFGIGILAFIIGFSFNVHSGSVLMRLRESGEKGYKIPLQANIDGFHHRAILENF